MRIERDRRHGSTAVFEHAPPLSAPLSCQNSLLYFVPKLTTSLPLLATENKSAVSYKTPLEA